ADLVRGSGRSVVTVVHEANYAAAWADHVVAMKDGAVAAEGPTDRVLTEPVLSALYDTPVEVSRHDGRPLVLHHHWHDQLDAPRPRPADATRALSCTEDMMISIARYDTPNAAKYLQQLARHLAHKIDVRSDEHSADFALQAGRVRIEADGAPVVRIEAEDARSLIDARYVIDKHLVIFAFREGFAGLDWRIADGA
ncbi:MAG TPA: DUF2218 domain-containing protein, partial [Paracoccus sp. (in: a-proteobacteria)]|nr:DUF2218 domain-containing protein [Paracoccus sp. (in: a-proteobacteria)]